MKSYFITGTDTNVGKTYVTCALARRARELGHRVFAFKPIETGCSGETGAYVGADQDLLVEAAGGWQRGDVHGLYQFALPAAPLVAAEAEHALIDLERIVQTTREGGATGGASVVLVEGAGGWRVPITRDADMSTLARLLSFPVILVARAGLGTINHTLLTIEAVERDGCSVAAVVLSRRPEDDLDFAESNRREILRRWSGVVVMLGTDTSVLDRLLA
jgi:dethiobiotin synthetase